MSDTDPILFCLQRLERDLQLFQSYNPTSCKIIQCEGSLLEKDLLIAPKQAPYNKGVFRVRITFPPHFPFEPPKLNFVTKIYHPNVGEDGAVYLSMLSRKYWLPGIMILDVVQALINLIQNPDVKHAIRKDIANEFVENRELFMRKAEEATATFSAQDQELQRRRGRKRKYQSEDDFAKLLKLE